jgi:hypothetical protein
MRWRAASETDFSMNLRAIRRSKGASPGAGGRGGAGMRSVFGMGVSLNSG